VRERTQDASAESVGEGYCRQTTLHRNSISIAHILCELSPLLSSALSQLSSCVEEWAEEIVIMT